MKKTVLDKETNNSAFNKTRKAKLEDWGKIRCSRCPYNKIENENHKACKSWKLRTKKRRQWNKSEHTRREFSFRWLTRDWRQNYIIGQRYDHESYGEWKERQRNNTSGS